MIGGGLLKLELGPDIIAKKQEKILMKGEGERISKAREAKKNET